SAIPAGHGWTAMTAERIALVGARGHVGPGLLTLVADHGGLELDFVVSREWAGQEVAVGEREPSGLLRRQPLRPAAAAKRPAGGAGERRPGGPWGCAARRPAGLASRAGGAGGLGWPTRRAAGYGAAVDAAGRGPVPVGRSGGRRFAARRYSGLREVTWAGAAG